MRGQVEEGFAALERGWALARAARDGPGLMWLAGNESGALLRLAQFQRAAEVASRGLDDARQAGLQSWDLASRLAAHAAEALLALGRTAEAAALIDPLTTMPPDPDHWLAQVIRAEIDLLRGDTGAAAERWQLMETLPRHHQQSRLRLRRRRRGPRRPCCGPDAPATPSGRPGGRWPGSTFRT